MPVGLPIALLVTGVVVGFAMATNRFALGGDKSRAAPEARRAGWVIVVVCAFGLLFTILTAGLR